MVEHAPISRLLPAVINALGLPIIDSAGRPMQYHLSYGERQLQEDETLGGAGVSEGDTLTIVPVMTAGTGATQVQELLQLGEVVRDHRPIAGLPRGASRRAALQVIIAQAAIERVWGHAGGQPDREVGGILVGTIYEEAGHLLVGVEEALEARYTAASIASLTFTIETWLDLLPRRGSRAESAVVGWYHSHPGHGIFLSEPDLHIHRSFFRSAPWYVALVVDPIASSWGVFGWEHGKVVRCAEARIA
jgi:proteasome lid subunit RPN8/RPN11